MAIRLTLDRDKKR